MEIAQLKIGTKLELELNSESEKKLDYTLTSGFEGMEDSNIILIAAPIRESVVYPIHIGTVLNIYFVLKAEHDYELYMFQSMVSARDTRDNIALLKIEQISEITRVQRRAYFRLGCSMPVKFRLVENMNEMVNKNIQYRNTIASNLSGGGMCLLLEENIEVGKMVECEIYTEEKVIHFFGKVVRHDKSPYEGKYKYEAGIVYIRINNNDRESVVKFIFNEQRKLRKKGLI
jgi:Predicted glycosyltransferase